jgi:regulator of protease activity HflC (stomatin/prohibitin superfamily)
MTEANSVAFDMSAVRAWSLLLALAAAAWILWANRRRASGLRPHAGAALAAATVLLTAWVLPQGLGRVQAGACGVVLRFGAPTGRALGEGVYYVIPLAERVVQVNTQVNTITLDRAQGTAHDLEPVYVDLAVSFHVVPARAVDVYRSLRDEYAARVVAPAVQDALKATVANYTSSDLIARRGDVQADFAREVGTRLDRFGLALDAVATTRFNFSYSYARAAQAKVASVQHTLEAEQDLQRIRFESQQGVIRAKSEIEALKLQRSVPFGQLMQLRQLDLQRRAIDKWDGKLPSIAPRSD